MYHVNVVDICRKMYERNDIKTIDNDRILSLMKNIYKKDRIIKICEKLQ